MARNVDEYCMLCDSTPCVCRAAKSRSTRPKPVQSEPQEKPSALAAMERDSRRLIRSAPSPATPGRDLTDEESEWIDGIKTAVRYLGATFLDPDEERLYRTALAEPDSPRLRAQAWRARVGRG